MPELNDTFKIIDADSSHGEAMLALMPRLADYDVPETRNPKNLWENDAAMMREWMNGNTECLVHVALDDDENVIGFSMVTLGPELLSKDPSAHLEAIAVDKRAERRGVAKALLKAAEASARAHGARTMSLHVFSVNERARRLYERVGLDGELMRYIKHLS